MIDLFLENVDLLDIIQLEGKMKELQQDNEDFLTNPDREQGSVRTRTTAEIKKDNKNNKAYIDKKHR